MMSHVRAIRTASRMSFKFTGRASRSEFWIVALFVYVLIQAANGLISQFTPYYPQVLSCGEGPRDQEPIALAKEFIAFTPLLLIPTMVRRWHDLGLPGFGPVLFALIIITVNVLNPFNQFVNLTEQFDYAIKAIAANDDIFWHPHVFVFENAPALDAASTALVLIVSALPGNSRTNRYGPSPIEVTP